MADDQKPETSKAEKPPKEKSEVEAVREKHAQAKESELQKLMAAIPKVAGDEVLDDAGVWNDRDKLQKVIDVCHEKQMQMHEQRELMTNGIKRVSAMSDNARRRLEFLKRADGKEDPALEIKRSLKVAQQARAERAAKAKAALDKVGIPVKELTEALDTKSPLDKALAQKK